MLLRYWKKNSIHTKTIWFDGGNTDELIVLENNDLNIKNGTVKSGRKQLAFPSRVNHHRALNKSILVKECLSLNLKEGYKNFESGS